MDKVKSREKISEGFVSSLNVEIHCDVSQYVAQMDVAIEKADLLIGKLKEIQKISDPLVYVNDSEDMPSGISNIHFQTECHCKQEFGNVDVTVDFEGALDRFKKLQKSQFNTELDKSGLLKDGDMPGKQNSISRLQVFQAFTNAEDFVYSLWPIVHTMKTREELIKVLNTELTEEELQRIVTAAHEGHYPISLERLQ